MIYNKGINYLLALQFISFHHRIYLLHTRMSYLRMNTLCIYHPHFALFIHIEPLAEEEIVYVEPESIVQESSEEPMVLQQPQEEQQYVEEQPGYDYVPKATGELTTDPSEQG